MRRISLRKFQASVLLVFVAFGLMSMSGSAQSTGTVLCVTDPDEQALVATFDPNSDGLLTRDELQARADATTSTTIRAQLLELIATLDANNVTGFRFDNTGECAPPTATSAPAQPTATTAPGQPTATTAPGQPTATTAAGQPTATTVPGDPTATTVPGDPTATTVPGDDDDNGDNGVDDGDDGTDGGEGDNGAVDPVSDLPDTGQGPDSGQSNATFIALLGGMMLLIGAAFVLHRRREA